MIRLRKRKSGRSLHRRFNSKTEGEALTLTNTLYFLSVCEIILHLALSRTHILKRRFEITTFNEQISKNDNAYDNACFKNIGSNHGALISHQAKNSV